MQKQKKKQLKTDASNQSTNHENSDIHHIFATIIHRRFEADYRLVVVSSTSKMGEHRIVIQLVWEWSSVAMIFSVKRIL